MKKFIIQFVTLILIIGGSLYLTFNQTGFNLPMSGSATMQEKKINIDGTVLTVKVADTQATRTQGLSGVDSLPGDQGMLFVFPSPNQYRFWMKGMKFSIDMIFIRQGKVVDTLTDLPQPLPGQSDQDLPIYEPVVPVDSVLEVNAGFVSSHSIKDGDKINLVS